MRALLDELRVNLATVLVMVATLLAFPGAVLGFARDAIGV